MKVSIITAVYNNASYIGDCIKSVVTQSYPDIEYVVVDGGSTDGTLEAIEQHKNRISKVVSQNDEGYVYAMNKGLSLTGGDVVGFLHSDDFYAGKDVVAKVVKTFKERSVDSVYGDLVYVKRDDPGSLVRYWRSGSGSPAKIKKGWMPPHPTFFVKKHIYEKYGLFNTDFKIAADYELMLRFLYRHKINKIISYLNLPKNPPKNHQ